MEDPNSLPASDYGILDAYLQGVATVLPLARIGVYGSEAYLEHAQSLGLAKWFWRVGGWSQNINPTFHLCQQVGNVPAQFAGQVDTNVAIQADWGGWDGQTVTPPVPAPPAPPAPVPTPPEQTMIGTSFSSAPHPSGHGGWVMGNLGHVYAFGGATYQGGAPDNGTDTDFTAIVASKTGNGYLLVRQSGATYGYGDFAYPGNYQPVWGALTHGLFIAGAVPSILAGGAVTLIRSDDNTYTIGSIGELLHVGFPEDTDIEVGVARAEAVAGRD